LGGRGGHSGTASRGLGTPALPPALGGRGGHSDSGRRPAPASPLARVEALCQRFAPRRPICNLPSPVCNLQSPRVS
jgi:hypothetical protein